MRAAQFGLAVAVGWFSRSALQGWADLQPAQVAVGASVAVFCLLVAVLIEVWPR